MTLETWTQLITGSPAIGLGSYGDTVDPQCAGESYSIAKADFRRDWYRFEVREGEAADYDNPASVNRAEFECDTRWSFNTDYWISYAFCMRPGDTILTGWSLFGQLHHSPDAGEDGFSPPFAIEYNTSTGNLEIVRRTSTQNPLVTAPTRVVAATIPFQRGRVYHILQQHNINPTGTGKHNVWFDGSQVLSYSGHTGYVDAVGPYWKMGIYREASTETLVVDYANFEMTTASLDARRTSPLVVG